ncbi:hypothetical protein INR49_024587 [Caranx melampygus]|nr:hypothetical protein INR49_024587 [Caranx melampygus]
MSCISGEKGTLTHGSVVNGRFEGFIKTHQGTYYVEPSERYLQDKDVPFHSVIYHEDDINYPHKYGSEGGCADHSVFERMRKFQASAAEEPAKGASSVVDEESSYGPVILRRKRAAGKEKNTCQLFIQTDHLFFKYYGTREAVIAQVNTTIDEKDKSNPFRFANIGRMHPGESKIQDKKEQGNYIMYARATSGDKLNNNKFSICSIRNISAVLTKKRDICFVESGQPICGNGLVEPGEECDCGYSDQCQDTCCYSANEEQDKSANSNLAKSAGQIPTQGPCCSSGCTFKGTEEKCRPESECAFQGACNGATAQCPTSAPKENFTSCHAETQVCINGVCSGSICSKYGLEVCTCASEEGKDEAAELCHVCCMEKMNPSTCSSTGSEKWAKFFNKKVTTLQPGSPCNDFKGYCDVFMRCRLVDADGPLARLKKAIFNAELYENIAEWIVVRSLVGSAADGHCSYYANGGLHQDLQCPHPQQQPQTSPTKASARYTETEKTAGTPTGTGPASAPSIQRELSDGTDETLRLWSALCLGSS